MPSNRKQHEKKDSLCQRTLFKSVICTRAQKARETAGVSKEMSSEVNKKISSISKKLNHVKESCNIQSSANNNIHQNCATTRTDYQDLLSSEEIKSLTFKNGTNMKSQTKCIHTNDSIEGIVCEFNDKLTEISKEIKKISKQMSPDNRFTKTNHSQMPSNASQTNIIKNTETIKFTELENLTKQLKTSIEVLEADNLYLKSKLKETSLEQNKNSEPEKICELESLVKQLQTSLSVSEADNNCLRNELREVIKENEKLKTFYNAGEIIDNPDGHNNLCLHTTNSFETLTEEMNKEERTSTSKESTVYNTPTPLQKICEKQGRGKVQDKRKNKNKEPPKNDVTIQEPRKLYVFGDSQAKGLYEKLNKILPTTDIYVCSNPNGNSEYILNNATSTSQELNQEDVLIVIAGTNDFDERVGDYYTQGETLISRLKLFTANHQNCTNIITIPPFYRHDLNLNHKINNEIKKLNEALSKISSCSIKYINSLNFQRRFFTQHGLHLNQIGKQKLCQEIHTATKEIFNSRNKNKWKVTSNSFNINKEEQITSTTDRRWPTRCEQMMTPSLLKRTQPKLNNRMNFMQHFVNDELTVSSNTARGQSQSSKKWPLQRQQMTAPRIPPPSHPKFNYKMNSTQHPVNNFSFKHNLDWPNSLSSIRFHPNLSLSTKNFPFLARKPLM